jgi:hypothetical protein
VLECREAENTAMIAVAMSENPEERDGFIETVKRR